MTRPHLPTPPHLLRRAARGSEQALHTFVHMRKERAYYFACSLRAGELEPHFPEELDAHAMTPDALLGRWDLVFALHRAVAALPRAQREVLVLADLEGLDSEQVAWLLDLDERELQLRLLQARTLVREQLMSGAASD
jgi:DNA-directed RNA polymerase specialized sigma24 family protein